MMPSQRLVNRVGNLQASPVWLDTPAEVKDALIDRVFDADEFTDLPEADRELIRRGELEVAAGLSSAFQDPSTWGDWTAIDAALDSGDMEALDRALEAVGPGDGAGMVTDNEGVLTPEEEAELATYDDEVKELPADDPGWVG